MKDEMTILSDKLLIKALALEAMHNVSHHTKISAYDLLRVCQKTNDIDVEKAYIYLKKNMSFFSQLKIRLKLLFIHEKT